MLAASALVTLGTSLLLAVEPVGKVPPGVAKEMVDAIVAANKALGLESWEAHGAKPCVDRGGEGAGSKDVSAADARACAETAISPRAFPGLGKSYSLAILMASIGPSTVVAFGMGDAAGWGAYSCDPGRKCLPTKITPTTKWGKRLVDRQIKACGQPATLWFPAQARVCDGVPGLPPPAGEAPQPSPQPRADAGPATTPPPATPR